MRGITARAMAATVVVLVATGACTNPPSATKPPKETVVHNDLTQKQATAGVDNYVQLIGTQLPPGGQLASLAQGTGTVNCHTPDGEQRTGQIFVRANYSVEGVDPDQYPIMVNQLRDIWAGLGYRTIDDTHYQDKDRTVRVATPADDYHLTIYSYGDNRSTPLVVIESPCAWPDPAPSTSRSGLGGS